MNEVIQNILSRRSVRSFKEDQISENDLSLVLKAAAYAPSGMNAQSWHFTAIQNKEKLSKLNELVKTTILNYPEDDNSRPAAKLFKKNAQNPNFNFFYNAPTLIITSNGAPAVTPVDDNALAMGNMFLAANSLNIDSCWIHTLSWLYDLKEIREYLTELGVPEDHKVYGSAAIGFNAGNEPKTPDRKEGTITIVK